MFNDGGLGEAGYVEMILFYPDQGLMIDIPGKTNKGKIQHVCLSEKYIHNYGDSTILPTSPLNFLLWNPENRKSFEEAGEELGLVVYPGRTIQQDYVSIEKLGDLNISSFYERYKNPDNINKCFDITDP